MCLPLVGRIVGLDGSEARVEILGSGSQARVALALFPDAAEGQHVLIDRGIIFEVIEASEAEELLAFYRELAGESEPVEAGND